jgi:hypothetical protein
MKWLAATALTTAMVTGFFMFEGGVARVALAAPETIQLAQNSSTSGSAAQSRSVDTQTRSQGQPAAGTPDRTGQPGMQGNQPPNVTSTGPNANAPSQGSPAASARDSSSGSASVSGSTTTRGSAGVSGAANNNTTGTGGAVSNRTNSGATTSSSNRATGTGAARSNSMSQSDMSSGTTRSSSGKSTRKTTARAKSDHTNMGSAGSSTRSRSMGTASRSRDSGDRATTALNWLSAQGYHDVKEIRQQGNMFVATVNKDGRSQQLTVDPASGRISPAS